MSYYHDPIRRMSSSEALHYSREYDRTNGVRQADGLTKHVTRDVTGREITTFSGDPACWMDQFKGDSFLMVKINKATGNGPRIGGQITLRDGKVVPA
ncbi:hypothetical protein [Caballeronia grimmiae]|uniref:hypothetical protein n=1 Tax=Caballeronia grimmiae TaxID=1071679 RepID=UPI0038BB028C